MSKLLINESPLQVLPSLAEVIGLKEAMVLQQIHWWLNASTNEYDGHVWVYNTYSEWQEQFPFWSETTVRRTIRGLEDDGYLISAKPHEDKGNRTKWYRINYGALDKVEPDPPCVQDEQMGVQNDRRGDQSGGTRGAHNARARSENTTQNTTEESESAHARKEVPVVEGEPPCTIDEAIEKGEEVMVGEELCREWWHHYNAEGWPKEFYDIGSALKKWKLNDLKFNGSSEEEETYDESWTGLPNS